MPTFALPSVVALWALCGMDMLRGEHLPNGAFVASLAGLATAFGLVQGLALDLALNRLPRLGQAGRLIPPLIPIAAAVWLANSLGVFVRLSGRHQELAFEIGGACLVGGLLAALVALRLQCHRDGRPGWLLTLSETPRVAAGFVFLISGMLALIADHRLYVGLYPMAHVTLRVAASLGLTLALIIHRSWEPLGERAIPLFILALFVPTALLSNDADDALQEYALRPFSSTLLHAARSAFDFDRDGFSALLGGGDCNDRDPKVSPAAREVPDNGIDDNCFFGDSHSKPEHESAVPTPQGQSPLSVVLITVDTLRWDRLGLNDPHYGASGKDTMPNLSRWASHSLNFARAYSAGSWTSIALAALTRGLYARRLTWVPHYETNRFRMLRKDELDKLGPDERISKMFPLAWRDPHKPLSFWLKRRGMTTVAVIDDSFSLMLAGEFGCDEGFDRYREVNPGASLRPRFDDEDTARIAIRQLHRLLRANKPFFLWVHFFGPHGPSTIHPGVRLDSRSIEDEYDQEVRFADMKLNKLLNAIEPHTKNLAVFVTSDHGEEITSDFRSHGTSAQEFLIRVPFVARVPGWGVGNYDKPISHVDLVPTILALTKTPGPSALDGLDLDPLIRQRQSPRRKALITDSWGFNRNGKAYVDMVAAYDGTHKLVLDRRHHEFSRFIQDDINDRSTNSSELLSGPLMNALMSYVEETGGAIDLRE